MKSKPPVPEPPTITFAQNIMYRDDATNRSVFLEAGRPSPWRDITDVPVRLQNLVGEPNTEPPRFTATQYWASPEQLANEKEMIDRLNADADMDPDVKAALGHRDEEYVQLASRERRCSLRSRNVMQRPSTESLAKWSKRRWNG